MGNDKDIVIEYGNKPNTPTFSMRVTAELKALHDELRYVDNVTNLHDILRARFKETLLEVKRKIQGKAG